MKRLLMDNLLKWKDNENRKPLMLRGARQVGKTWLVREFAKKFDNYIEINFEKEKNITSIFTYDLNIKRIVQEISIYTKKEIKPEKTLLFLDEIQACPEAIKSLRYFYEDLKDLHVVAAGSLIDFTIEQIGVPVGRIEFRYLYPISFIEYLLAKNEELLVKHISNGDFKTFSPAIHKKGIKYLGEYLAVGGMPEAVDLWLKTGDFKKAVSIHKNIRLAYEQDFEKYAKQHQIKYVDSIFKAVPLMVGKKFIFSSIIDGGRSRELGPAVTLLKKAGVLHPIFHSSSNGVPLCAEINLAKFKTILLDIGLMQSIQGDDYSRWIYDFKNQLINRGQVIEAFVGQELLAYASSDMPGELFYWVREASGSLAKVDYITTVDSKIIPIEVKSGKKKNSKSLHQFLLHKKNTPFGIKLSPDIYSKKNKIYEWPLYAISAI